MAYMRDLDRKCDRCQTKRATVAVFNNQNTHMGDCCRSCGASLVRTQNASEQRQATRDNELRARGLHTNSPT